MKMMDKPRGRPGTRRKWQSQEDNEIAARLLLAMDGYMPVKWVSKEELQAMYPVKSGAYLTPISFYRSHMARQLGMKDPDETP